MSDRKPSFAVIAEHIDYEFGMFVDTSDGLDGLPAEMNLDLRALLEAWAIHFRNLYDFLKPQQGRRRRKQERHGHAFAWEYVEDWRSPPELGAPCVLEDRKRVDILLAHISKKRPEQSDLWQCGASSVAIVSAFRSFADALPSKSRAKLSRYVAFVTPPGKFRRSRAEGWSDTKGTLEVRTSTGTRFLAHYVDTRRKRVKP